MFRSVMVLFAVVSLVAAFCSTPSKAQEKSNQAVAAAEATHAIPFRMLQQIVQGYGHEPIKSDLSEAQVEAMKKVQSAQNNRELEVTHLSGMLSQSPFRNRRFRAAIDQLRAENEELLRAQWMEIITPEQQKTLRRRNRQAILRASLESQQVDRSLLESQESIDQLVTNEDLLSVIERPAVQDLLEITDEQFNRVEELRANARGEALLVLKSAAELARVKPGLRVAPPVQSDVWKRLNERTMKVLNPEQSKAYHELLSNPGRFQKLVSRNADATHPRFQLMMPHGSSRSIRTEVKDGQVTTTVGLHNAFENPELVKELKLTDAQQMEISKILDELRPEIVAGIEASQKAHHQHETEKRKGFDDLLKAHNQQFHTKALSLLTVSQLATLEKERYGGLGLTALQKPQIVAALNLTEEQSKAIANILAQKAPNVEMPMMGPSSTPEEFQKQAEEFHKRARENGEKYRAHHEKKCEEILAVMSEEQCAKFAEMTGFELRKKLNNAAPVISL